MCNNNNHLPPDKRILNTKEVADLLRVHTSTVTRWAYNGEIKHFKKGKVLRFRQSDIWEFFDNLVGKSVASLKED